MKIILLDKIIRLGDIGDVVDVKSGFARNYLIPQKKAMFANDENIKIVEAKKAELAAESEDLKVQAQASADVGYSGDAEVARQRVPKLMGGRRT